MEIFAVYDKKANIFIPFLAPTSLDAQKALSFDVNMKANGGTQLSNLPEEFALYRLGMVLDTGEVFKALTPQFVVECSQLVVKQNEDKEAPVENIEDVY